MYLIKISWLGKYDDEGMGFICCYDLNDATYLIKAGITILTSGKYLKFPRQYVSSVKQNLLLFSVLFKSSLALLAMHCASELRNKITEYEFINDVVACISIIYVSYEAKEDEWMEVK